MNDMQNLFFHLTPITLAAIVIDLTDNREMYWQWQAALDAGFDNSGEDFWQMLEDERDSRPQANDDPKFCDPVAAILARQS